MKSATICHSTMSDPTEYSIEEFATDVLSVMADTDEEEVILSAVAPLARKVAAQKAWRTEDMFIADPEVGFGSTLLHAESDNSLFVVVDSWLPGRGVRPHDHGTWAVVVGVTGPEESTFWERTDDGSVEGHAQLRVISSKTISAGDVVTMKTGEIHSVQNDTDETTLSFHVYGRHLNFTGRSQFDTDNEREIPFLIETR